MTQFPGFGDHEKITDLPGNGEFKRKTQGQESNSGGKWVEDVIEREFSKRDVFVVPHTLHRNACGDMFARRVLEKNVPFKNMYGFKSRTEFVYHHTDGLRVRIECKRQEGPGSVDEKFPYLLENARSHMPERAVWIVLEGNGARRPAVDWAKKEAKLIRSKIVRVLTLSQCVSAIKQLVEDGTA